MNNNYFNDEENNNYNYCNSNKSNDSNDLQDNIRSKELFSTVPTMTTSTSFSLPLSDHPDNSLKSKIQNLKMRSRAILNSFKEN